MHDYDARQSLNEAPTWRQEMRVVAVVVAFVIILEVVARVIAPALDYDRKHIHDFPQIVSEMPEKSADSLSVLFYGNSLMRFGVDETLIASELNKDGGTPVAVTKVTPVGTAIIDWLYLYERYFVSKNRHPDVIVLGFVKHHVSDEEPIKLRRLARHFVSTQALPMLWRKDLQDRHMQVQSVLCHSSALMGDQPEHQLGILYSVIPEYKNGLNQNNDWIRQAAEDRAHASNAGQAPKKESFERVQRFIDQAKEQGIEVWFVPMPQPEFYELAPELRQMIEKNGMKWLDARKIPGMDEKDFSDGYHLGESGKKKLTLWLAATLQTYRESLDQP